MSNPFDQAALMDSINGDIEFLDETASMLNENCPALLDDIRAAAAAENATGLVKPAHALKSMVSNFCAEPAETAARELEAMGREGCLTGADHAIETLEHEARRLIESLQEFLRTRMK